MRKASFNDFWHFEFCDGELTVAAGSDDAHSYRIGDFFWNAEEESDGQFSIRLADDDIAFRAPLRVRLQLVNDRFADFAVRPRDWRIKCNCGALSLVTHGVMVAKRDPERLGVAYVHFVPGLSTDSPEIPRGQ